MALTLEQVHENNAVAKEWLKVIMAEIKAISASQDEHKNLSWKQRFNPVRLEMYQIEREMLHRYIEMKFHLELYFRSHYNTGALLSKYQSPIAQFSTYDNKLFWSIKKTYSIDDVPHAVKL